MRKCYYLVFVILIFLTGCRYAPTNKDRSATEVADSEFYDLTDNIKDVFYRFPSPDEMFIFIDSAGMQFNKDLLNDIKLIDNYLGTLNQSLILGVYTSDLAYITLFGKYKQSMDYLQTVYFLSERLNISDAFEKELITRIENNIRNIDSLKVISEDAFISLSNYLSKNDQENIFALISVGSYIEFMHISFSISGEYSSNNETIRRIGDQKIVFTNIVKFMREFSEDAIIIKTLTLLKPLEDFYNQIPAEVQKTKVTKKSDGQLVFGGKKKEIMAKDDYEKLKKIVSDIRAKIISSEI